MLRPVRVQMRMTIKKMAILMMPAPPCLLSLDLVLELVLVLAQLPPALLAAVLVLAAPERLRQRSNNMR